MCKVTLVMIITDVFMTFPALLLFAPCTRSGFGYNTVSICDIGQTIDSRGRGLETRSRAL